MKIMWLSDTPMSVTGYATMSRCILNGLADKGHECHILGHNYIGQTIKPGLTLTDGTKLNFYIHGMGRQPYMRDMIEPYLRQYRPDVFITLLDSVTEDRIIPILNRREQIEFLTFGELYDKYRCDFKGIKSLSAEIKNKKIVGIWKEIKGIYRRFVQDKDIIKITQKNGQTCTTLAHSLIEKKNNKLCKIKPDNLLKENKQLLSIDKIEPFGRKYNKNKKFDLMDYLNPEKYDYDQHWVWLKRSKDIKKIKRFLDKNELECFVYFIAGYLTEGCCNVYRKGNKSNYVVIISQNNKKWLEQFNKYSKISFKQEGSYSKNNNCYNLVCNGKIIYNLIKDICGKGCKNKKIPEFIYHMNEKIQIKFLELMIQGDGYVLYNTYNKQHKRYNFTYTTISPKLCSSLSFLLKQLKIIHSFGYNDKRRSYTLTSVNKKTDKIGKTFVKKEKYTGYIYDVMIDDTELFIDGCGLTLTGNTFMVYDWFNNLDFAPAHSIFYFPSDGGGGMPLGCESILRKVNLPVSMSRYGQRQVAEVHNIPCAYIPHGVDTKNYYPLPDTERQQLKAKYNLQDKFVFGTVARNQGRKMLDRTLKAFALFAKDHPDARLFMHTDPEDNAAIFPLPSMIQRYNIQNRVVFSGMRAFRGFDYKDMNKVYNLMDCHLLSTSGEGFGCITIEAAACGVPSIVTDYTTTQELLIEDGKCGLPVKIIGTEDSPNVHGSQIMNGTITGSWMVERAVMCLNDCVEQMKTIYNDPKLCKELGKTGVQKAKNLYSWDVVIDQWDKVINQLVNKDE